MRTMLLASSGFGKTTSIARDFSIKHIGLNPKDTFYISTTNRELPFDYTEDEYKLCTNYDVRTGNWLISNNFNTVQKALNELKKGPRQNIVIDDFNYLIQDYYMGSTEKDGWKTARNIGKETGVIFDLINEIGRKKDIFLLAHPAIEESQDGRVSYKLKTIGNMIDNYITPEGKFENVIIGVTEFDVLSKKSRRMFIVQDSDKYVGAKTPQGMLPFVKMPNDMGLLKYYMDKKRGVEAPHPYVEKGWMTQAQVDKLEENYIKKLETIEITFE